MICLMGQNLRELTGEPGGSATGPTGEDDGPR